MNFEVNYFIASSIDSEVYFEKLMQCVQCKIAHVASNNKKMNHYCCILEMQMTTGVYVLTIRLYYTMPIFSAH